MNIILRGLIVILSAAACFVACNQGDTDGGGNDSAPGAQFISDDFSSGKLTIKVEEDLVVAGTAEFLVLATDPDGQPIQFLKVTCNSEKGIAILEPSKGFEHTSQRGGMSGVLGGDAPGSYLLQCTASYFGNTLVAKKTINITGEIPPGFTGFPGAAGGGLGGGLVDDGDDDDTDSEQVNFVDILFTTKGGTSQIAIIDLNQIIDCDGDPSTPGFEPFGEDQYTLTLNNTRDSAIEIDTVEFSIDGVVTSFTQLTQVVIDPKKTNNSLNGPYTFVSGSVTNTKRFSGTAIAVPAGTFNVTFTVTGSNLDQTEPFTVTRSAVMTANDYYLCPTS